MLRLIMRRVACMAVVALVASCQGGEKAVSPEPTGVGGSATQAAPGADLSMEASGAPGQNTEEVPTNLGVSPVPSAAVEPVQQDAEESPEEGEPEQEPAPTPRDLGAELQATVGDLSDCLTDLQRATPVTIPVTLTALVRPSGVIIQPTASGTGLSPNARQCIVRRIDAVTLRPLAGDVSQRVSTVVEIEYVPPPLPKSSPPPEQPTSRNVREPLPKRPEVAPSGRPIQEPTSRPIQDDKSRPIQDTKSRKIRGPKPRPIDGWEVDESAKEWR